MLCAPFGQKGSHINKLYAIKIQKSIILLTTMKLIAGTIVYETSEYLENSFSGFLHQSFLRNNVSQIDGETFHVLFQNNHYEIKVEKLLSGNCNAISIYSDFSNKVRIGKEEKESNIGTGMPKLIRQQLICQKSLEWYDCKMLEPSEFEKLKERIEEREISFNQLRKLYIGNFDENKNFRDCIFNFDLEEIKLGNVTKTVKQPWTLNIVESANTNSTLCKFFIKVGIELDWDNTVYFDTYFIPISFKEMKVYLRIDESTLYINKLTQNDEIKNITLVQKEDELSFLIKTNKRYVYFQELFWWS